MDNRQGASSPSQPSLVEMGTSGASSPSPPQKRRKGGSDVKFTYGTRRMKAYPITESELGDLAKIGILAAIAFSVATGFFGFGINILKDISLNEGISIDTKTFWQFMSIGSFVISVIALAIGIGLVRYGRTKIANIKAETEFQ
ncbi:MAG: hypothetical protein AB7Q01_12265 [Gammaproteobacteria bacterium]